jgi:predicted glycosyltransferase
MIWFVFRHKIDLLTGSTPEVAHVSWVTQRYGVNTGEDDMDVVPAFNKIAGPFVDTILSPYSCDNGNLEKKTIKYAVYHELAYLHPSNFVPQEEIARKYVDIDRPYFILRFAKLNAHHDDGIHGINTAIAQHLLDVLLPHGNVYITAERELEPQFEKYRIHIKTIDMHHVMAYADMYVGDSQTMAEEAAMLGVPFVRFNGFVGRIGCLEELEQNGYKLGYGVKPENEESLYSAVNEILSTPNRYEVYQKRRETLLADKIDYAAFLTWFIENYPKSKEVMNETPEYQYRFR